jgi:hypothetical protein
MSAGQTHSALPKVGLERDVDGNLVGSDPSKLSIDELGALGHCRKPMLKTLRAYCLDCCCYQPSEVTKCPATRCPLWPYRLGKNPWRKATKSQRAASRNNMAAIQRKLRP